MVRSRKLGKDSKETTFEIEEKKRKADHNEMYSIATTTFSSSKGMDIQSSLYNYWE